MVAEKDKVVVLIKEDLKEEYIAGGVGGGSGEECIARGEGMDVDKVEKEVVVKEEEVVEGKKEIVVVEKQKGIEMEEEVE